MSLPLLVFEGTMCLMEKSSDLYLFQDTGMTFTANHYSKGHSVMLDDLCNTYSILIEEIAFHFNLTIF